MALCYVKYGTIYVKYGTCVKSGTPLSEQTTSFASFKPNSESGRA